MFFSVDTAHAETTQANYLVLGDSISTGYGLSDPTTQSFAALLTADQDLDLNNLAVSGNTMANLATTLTDKSSTGAISDEAIENADIISITAGGNDCMYALYGATANYYNETVKPDVKITAADVPTIISNTSDSRRWMVMLAMGVILSDQNHPFVDSDEFTTALANYGTNLQTVVDYIHGINPDALLFIDTQYNPYAVFKGGSSNYVYAAFESCVAKLNDVIADTDNGTGTTYQVVDVDTAFADNVNSEGVQDFGASLCNASADPLNLDFHPNKTGHQVIANTIITTLGHDISTPQTVTLNGVTATLTFSTDAVKILPNVPVTATITFSGQPDSTSNSGIYKLTYSNAETKKSGSYETKYLSAGQAVSESTTFAFSMPASDVKSFNLALLKTTPLAVISIDATQAVAGTELSTTLLPAGATATYQWYADGTVITGATGSTYTPTADDVGKTLTVKVNGTGDCSGTVESTGLVVKAADSGKTDGGGNSTADSDNNASTTSGGSTNNVSAASSTSKANTIPYTGDGFPLLLGILALAASVIVASQIAVRKAGKRRD